jgi:predicted transcriptional regulator
MCEMIDAAHEVIMAAVARGEQEMLAAEETVAAPTPLAFWRVRRGLTQKQPSQTAGVSQSYITDLEVGRRWPPFSSASPRPCVYAWRITEEVLAEPASRPKKEMAP